MLQFAHKTVRTKEINDSIFGPVLRTFYITILLLVLSACNKPQERACLKGTGDQTSETRGLGPFHSLVLYDFIDYDLIQDSTDKVVVHCGENLIEFVTTQVDHGALSIRDENKCHWLRSLPVKIKVDIHFTELQSIRNESAGTLRTIDTLRQTVFFFDNYHSAGKNLLMLDTEVSTIRINAGGPLVRVSGKSHQVFLRNSGTGKLEAENLIITDYAWVDNQHEGYIRTHLQGGILQYLIDSYGDVYYRGDPDHIEAVSHSGSGALIPLDG